MQMKALRAISFLPLLLGGGLLAQDQSLAPADLKYTKSIIESQGVVVDVTMRTEGAAPVRYQYESSPGTEKISTPTQSVVRMEGGNWMSLDKKDKPAAPADPQFIDQWNSFASIPHLPFQEPVSHDTAQGGTVWKFIGKEAGRNFHLFTFERTREHPRPDGFYPHYTFIKYEDDEDGQLLLAKTGSNLRDEAGKLFPVEMQFHYKKQHETAEYEFWITGEVFSEGGVLFFKTDKPVKGNPLKNVVLLGSSKAAMKVLLPAYAKAAESHRKLRLYGVMLPFDGKMPGYKKKLPNAQFITWKMHLPGEPDELPGYEKIIIHPEDSVPGYDIKPAPKGSPFAK